MIFAYKSEKQNNFKQKEKNMDLTGWKKWRILAHVS